MSLLSAKQDEEVMAEINITPFTDVLLVLLIIFKSDNSPQTKDDPHKNIEVDVNNKGKIYVDGIAADDQTIYRVMYDASIKKPHKHVAITADAKAPYGIIIRILDAAKEAGLDDVGFVTS